MIEKFSALGKEAPIGPESYSEFSELKEPENFSLNLVDWTQEQFEMEDEDVVEIVKQGTVCLDSGKCVRPADVGSNCCLF